MEPPSRHRSPPFTPFETKLLVDLIEKYGYIITNKCTNTASNMAKEKVWQKITKTFNEANIGNLPRQTETLRSKWENLKKRNAKSDEDTKKSDIVSKVLSIIETYKDPENSVVNQDLSGDSDADLNNDKMEDTNVVDERDSSDTDDESTRKRMKARSMNFSPSECQLLISLVKNEKGGVFSDQLNKKNLAWRRITEAFNKRLPEKRRTYRMLQTKFKNMKNVAKKMNNRDHENIIKPIKEEPVFLNNPDYSNDMTDFSETREVPMVTETNDCPDPLKVVDNWNSDSGIGYGSDTFKITQDKELTAVHKQLLDYQLETSKLERKRIQDAIEADAENRKVKSLINAMKLRTARLEMIAAETKLPVAHPALNYTDGEEIIATYH